MSPIDALKLSFQSPVESTTKSFKQKTDYSKVKDPVAFAELFASVSTESQIDSAESPNEMQKKLSEVLDALQDLSLDNLSSEELEAMYGVFQMFSLQTIDIKAMLQGTNLEQEKVKTLLLQIQQELQQVSIAKIHLENGVSTATQLEQITQQLEAILQQLKTEQQSNGKQSSFQQLSNVKQEMESPIQNIEMQHTNPQNENTSKQLTNLAPDSKGLQTEPLLVGENSPPLTGSALDATKAGQAPQRPETSVPTPTVRMANIIEELGEVLQSSLRLNGNKEGMQIRVNIFPEHLGNLDIRITETNGKIAALILTSNLIAKEALDLQVNQMRNTLIQQGVTIDKIEIAHDNMQQSFGQQNAHPEQRSSQQHQKHGTATKNRYQGIEDEATVVRTHLVDGLMKVDYTI